MLPLPHPCYHCQSPVSEEGMLLLLVRNGILEDFLVSCAEHAAGYLQAQRPLTPTNILALEKDYEIPSAVRERLGLPAEEVKKEEERQPEQEEEIPMTKTKRTYTRRTAKSLPHLPIPGMTTKKTMSDACAATLQVAGETVEVLLPLALLINILKHQI